MVRKKSMRKNIRKRYSRKKSIKKKTQKSKRSKRKIKGGKGSKKRATLNKIAQKNRKNMDKALAEIKKLKKENARLRKLTGKSKQKGGKGISDDLKHNARITIEKALEAQEKIPYNEKEAGKLYEEALEVKSRLTKDELKSIINKHESKIRVKKGLAPGRLNRQGGSRKLF